MKQGFNWMQLLAPAAAATMQSLQGSSKKKKQQKEGCTPCAAKAYSEQARAWAKSFRNG